MLWMLSRSKVMNSPSKGNLILPSFTPVDSTGIANEAVTVCHDKMLHKTGAK